MEGLLAQIDLANGKRLNLYEDGILWLTDTARKAPYQQAIKLTAGAGLALLDFLQQWADTLDQAQQSQFAWLEETFGPATTYSEHKRGERITYRTQLDEVHQGMIVWVAAAGKDGPYEAKLRYVVEADFSSGLYDVVWSNDILENEA